MFLIKSLSQKYPENKYRFCCNPLSHCEHDLTAIEPLFFYDLQVKVTTKIYSIAVSFHVLALLEHVRKKIEMNGRKRNVDFGPFFPL